MEETLASFRAAYDLKPWKPSVVDCMMVLASWSIWLGYPDPAAHLRETYHDEDGFRAIVAAAGGGVALVGRCAANIGAKRVQRPSCGSIGVIGSPTKIDRQFGAIYDGERWLVRFENRTDIMTAKTLAVWDI